jgi:uncharacterized MAPEG superfamily protein
MEVPEARVLALAGLLQAVQYVVMAVPANLELGTAKTLSPRDPARLGRPLVEQVSPVTGRLFRALQNHFEGLVLFTLAVVALALTGPRTASRFSAPGFISPPASSTCRPTRWASCRGGR